MCTLLLILVTIYLAREMIVNQRIGRSSLEDDPLAFWATVAFIISMLCLALIFIFPPRLTKPQLYGALALIAIVVFVSTVVIFYAWFISPPTPVRDIVVCICMIGLTVISLYTDTMPGGRGSKHDIPRAESPSDFWFYIGANFLIAVFCISRLINNYLNRETPSEKLSLYESKYGSKRLNNE